MSPAPPEHAALASAIMSLLAHWQAGDRTASRILGVRLHRYQSWKAGRFDDLDDELVLRLTLLLQIHAGLRLLYRDPVRGYAWMRRPNDAFGQAPLRMLASGRLSELVRLHAYLTAEAW